MSSIYLLPLGGADPRLVADLRSPLRRTFQSPVEVRAVDVDLQKFYDEHRVQYNSTAILTHLLAQWDSILPAHAEGARVLAVVAQDLFIPILTFVFGEAQLGGKVAVVSYHRLAPERYGLPPDRSLFAARLEKEALHELGHVYGLVHCQSQDCVMHTSTYAEDIDLKSRAFCALCHSALDKV